jgi:lipoprotein signal peptidase
MNWFSRLKIRTVWPLIILIEFLLCLSARLTVIRFDGVTFNSGPFMGWSGLYYNYSFALIAIVFLLINIKFIKSDIEIISTTIIIGAAICNIIEYRVYQNVADYLPGLFNTRANLADYLILLGVVILSITIWRRPDMARREKYKLS